MSLSQDGVGPVRTATHEIHSGDQRECVESEDELPPSFDALWYHWQQTCWVSNVWNRAARNYTILLDITHYGWIIVDRKLECDWESVVNREVVRQQVDLLFRGYSCSSM